MPTPVALTPYDSTRGTRAVAAALAEWKSGVREPPQGDPERIREYLRACGFGHADDYHADGDAEWCGAFAAFCLIASGVRPELLRQKSPPEAGGAGSTYRLHSLCVLDERRRIVSPDDLHMGDVVCVGRKGRTRYGEHIVVACDPPKNGTFETLEGNASGSGPNGNRYEGVVRRSRMCIPTEAVKGFVFGFRPIQGDYV